MRRPKKGEGESTRRLLEDGDEYMRRHFGMPLALVGFDDGGEPVIFAVSFNRSDVNRTRGLSNIRELEVFPLQRDAAHRFERHRRHGPLYYDRGVLVDSEIHPHVLEEECQ